MIEACGIFVRLGYRKVLEDISFELPDGQLFALVGPNGSGKTTLIRTLNGTLIPYYRGRAVIDGIEIGSMPRRDIASKVAVVAQENETKFPITVLDFVLAGRFVHGRAFGWETESDIKIARRALADCELSEFADRLMNELSGGERQRVVLARALATGANTLLLDEPTANLDLAHQAMMFRLVRERCRSCNASAIVITHDLNLASEFSDRILLIKSGRIFALGKPAEVLTAENIQNVFDVNVLLDENPVSGNVRVTGLYQ